MTRLGRLPSPIYTRIKRISLYAQHAALKPFFIELETLPNELANEALLRAVSLGAGQAIEEARQAVERRRGGRPEPSDLQPALLPIEG